MDTPTGDYFLKKANDFSSELDDIEISATLGYSSDKTAPIPSITLYQLLNRPLLNVLNEKNDHRERAYQATF